MLENLSPRITGEVAYRWRLVRDFVAGEKRVKDCGPEYLPMKSGSDPADYEAYKARGKVGDYTEQALETFHGQVMRKQPVLDVPDAQEMKSVLDDFNREGDTFYQFASDVVHDNLQTFFGGIMVDMPVTPEGVSSVHDAEREGIRPYARYYPAECVLDWDYRYVRGARRLSMVRLAEDVDVYDYGSFTHTSVRQFRELTLDGNGEYRVRVMREVSGEDDSVTTVTTFETYPVVRGERLDYIPFFFTIYRKPEPSLLYGVAELHKHYYLQSCDYENGVHMTTIPTGYVTGHVQEKDGDGFPVPIYLGRDIFLVFPEPEAKVGVLQFSGEGIEHCEKAIAQTLEQIGILGTRALAPDKAMSETSDAARIHRTGENCKLGTYSRNMGRIFTKVLQVMADWMGLEGRVSVQFNTDFDSIAFDPNALNAIANLAREGKYPLPLVFEALKKGEYLPADMDFREFGMLVSLEAGGASVEEVIDVYQRLRSGEKVVVRDRTPVEQLNADRAANDRPAEETRIVSMESGK